MLISNKVLVTGASGFIGAEIVCALEKEGFLVTRSTRLPGGDDPENGLIYLDLDKPETILGMPDDLDFDAIVHFGAHVGLGDSSLDSLYVPNIVSTGLLAYLAQKTGALLVFASSVMVHGMNSLLSAPDSPVSPDTPYGKSKWLAEELIKSSGARSCILRIGGVFGLNGPAHLGLNRAITNATNQIAPTLYGSGEGKRNYIYVRDAASTVAYIVQNDMEGCYLLSGAEPLSIRSMLEQICDVFMPGMTYEQRSGPDAVDQLIVVSEVLPKTTSFKDALLDIQRRMNKK